MTARDRLTLVLACVFFWAGLSAAKLAGWIDASWWLVALAPAAALAVEVLFLVPPAVAGTLRHHFRR
jgi:hypothetical protein